MTARRLTHAARNAGPSSSPTPTERFAADGLPPHVGRRHRRRPRRRQGRLLLVLRLEGTAVHRDPPVAQSDLRRRQQRAIDDVEDPVGASSSGIRAGVLWMAEHRDLRRLFEFARTEATFAAAWRAGQTVLVSDAVEHLKEAIAEGRIPDNDPEALAHGILGVSNRLCTIYIDERGDDPETVADLVVSFCRNGFAARRVGPRQPARPVGSAELGQDPLEVADRLVDPLLVLDEGEADVAVAAGPKPTPGDSATCASFTSNEQNSTEPISR